MEEGRLDGNDAQVVLEDHERLVAAARRRDAAGDDDFARGDRDAAGDAAAYRLTTPRQVEIWHAALPCSGRIVSITVRGRFATAAFRLGDRPTSKCDAPGALAAARSGIVRGKIVSWEQVPVDAAPGPVA